LERLVRHSASPQIEPNGPRWQRACEAGERRRTEFSEPLALTCAAETIANGVSIDEPGSPTGEDFFQTAYGSPGGRAVLFLGRLHLKEGARSTWRTSTWEAIGLEWEDYTHDAAA